MLPHKMKKQECRITDPDEIRSILDACERCRLSFADNNIPYTVPMNYGYTYEGDALTLFFHSSGEGRKIDIIRQNPIVCFEADCDGRLDPAGNPHRYAVEWKSIVGSGIIQYVTDFKEKRMILGRLIQKYLRYNPLYRPSLLTDDRVGGVTVFKLTLDEFQAKRELHR